MAGKGLSMVGGRKLPVLLSVIVTCILIAFYAGFIAHITIVYTHFFYIPILFAGIWYQRKTIYGALFLGIVHILVTYFSPTPLSINEFARAAIFLIVAYAVGYVSEREAKKGIEQQESHEQLKRIIDGSSIPAFVINKEHKITHRNTALEALTGVKKEEVVRTCTEEGEYWKFRVADNGPGIDKKNYEKIFQIFQTLTASDIVESTGISLTVVKKIVELHGGTIWVESKVGEGSSFFFTVPKQKRGSVI